MILRRSKTAVNDKRKDWGMMGCVPL